MTVYFDVGEMVVTALVLGFRGERFLVSSLMLY
jgi:hypothetical protein